MEFPRDNLGDGALISGLVILNYGDPTYPQTPDSDGRLHGAEAIFLHMLAYLLFAEAISIPSRYILEGDDMAQAIVWAANLLEEGLIHPERRADATSFDSLAASRQLPQLGFQRAAFLDRHTSRVRSFHYSDLSRTYRDLIADDLSPGGGFRRVVSGGNSGRYSESISLARRDYLQAGMDAPEFLVASIKKHAPALETKARRWAMARYYTTPLLFDTANTREIPASAADILIRGRVIDGAIPPFAGAAPAESAFNRLRATVPIEPISPYCRTYCEALLEVRRAYPEARQLFSTISDASHIKDAGDSLSNAFASELEKQLRVRSTSDRLFTVTSSLMGGGAGFGLGEALLADRPAVQLGGSLVLAVGSGVASNELLNFLRDRRDRKRRPWLLAMDRMEQILARRR